MVSRAQYEGYVFALLALAKENKRVQPFRTQASFVVEVLRTYPRYLRLLQSYEISSAVKKSLLRQVFKNVDPTLYHLMCLMVDRHRAHAIPVVLELFVHHVNLAQKVFTGTVYSRVLLSAQQLKQTTLAVIQKLGYQVTLKNTVDPQIIGGVRVVVNGVVVDNTVRARLDALRVSLLQQKEVLWR